MEVLPGEDERTIVRYVSRMAKLTGAEVLVTDDADAFKTAADTVGLKHQVCQQHVVPNTLRLVAEIASDLLGRQDSGTGGKPGALSSEQAIEDLASLETIILARAPSSQAELEALQQRYQKAPPPGRGKEGRQFLSDAATHHGPGRPPSRPGRGRAAGEDWTLNDTYREPDGRRFLPATNRARTYSSCYRMASEQRIGHNIKERYRTMRGYKRTASVRRVPALTACLREANDPRALASLLAG